MKIASIVALAVVCAGVALADTFPVGGKDLNIPAPVGFSRVTPEMGKVYRLTQQMVDPGNDQLAYYILESDVPIALSGNIPTLRRYFILKVNKKLKETMVSSSDFQELAKVVKKQNTDTVNSIKSQIQESVAKAGKGVAKELNVDLAMSLSSLVPLEPHYEDATALAYSMYAKMDIASNSSKSNYIASATATYANVSGKVLFLYCYGNQEDLNWTRSASQSWSDMIIKANLPPPSRTRKGGWDKVLEKGLSGAITGGVLALILSVLSKLKKKKG